MKPFMKYVFKSIFRVELLHHTVQNKKDQYIE